MKYEKVLEKLVELGLVDREMSVFGYPKFDYVDTNGDVVIGYYTDDGTWVGDLVISRREWLKLKKRAKIK